MLVAFRYNDKRLISRLLAWHQRTDVSHCEVVMASVGDAHRCAGASWMDGGVRIKVIDLAPTKWRLYLVPDGVDPHKWALRFQGAGYDWIGLLGFVNRRIKGSHRAWFCSEACADMMGLQDPWRYDVATLESVCASVGRRIQ